MGVDPTLHVAVPLRDLEREYAQASGQRLRGYLDLGRRAHQLVREGRLTDETACRLVGELGKVDRVVYALGKELASRRSGPKGARCPACGSPLAAGDRFCGACGQAIEVKEAPSLVCPACRTAFAGPAHFCPACGSPLPGEEAAGKAPRVRKPRGEAKAAKAQPARSGRDREEG